MVVAGGGGPHPQQLRHSYQLVRPCAHCPPAGTDIQVGEPVWPEQRGQEDDEP